MALLCHGIVVFVERLQRDPANVDVPGLVSASAGHAGTAATHHAVESASSVLHEGNIGIGGTLDGSKIFDR